MKVPNKSELIHMRIQAAMRENQFPHNELMYLGIRDDEHYYLIAGKHEVPVSALESFEREDDE